MDDFEIQMLKIRDLRYYINRMWSGDLEAREKIINHYISIVKNLVERDYSDDKEELLSCGFIGMIKAIDLYRPDNKNHLTTMVISYVNHEIKSYLKSTNNENEVKKVLYDDKNNMMYDYEDKEKKENLINSIDMLPYPDDIIIKLYFGIGFTKHHTQTEIANMFNMSLTRINQIFLRALVRLRNILELEPIKKVGKSSKIKSFYKLFQGYTTQQVKNVLFGIEKERLAIINYLYAGEYDAAIKRWNELDEKKKMEFYTLVDEIRVKLKKQNKCKQKIIK